MHNDKSPTEPWPWPKPSERVRELIRQGAEQAVRAPADWLAEIDSATMSPEFMDMINGDPVLIAATRRTNRANMLHWAASNVRDPGAPVAANVGAEPVGIARDLVRRGVGELALHAYRTGQNAAWRRWMEIAFELTNDAEELRELLDITARSISSFIDATIAAISERILVERDELTRGTHAERLEVVALVLKGAPITQASASHRLGYDLDGAHRAAVVWSDAAESDLGALEHSAEAVATALSGSRALTVVASVATLWVWVPGEREPDRDQLHLTLQQLPDVRVAIGSPARGVEGFRRSHFDAITTQRMLARVGSEARVATFDEVRLVSLVTHDPDAAKEFVTRILGDLVTAPAELRAALLTFLTEGCHTSRAAERLHTHRNTLLRRLSRAEALLPRPLADNRLQVAVALDVLRWQRGPS